MVGKEEKLRAELSEHTVANCFGGVTFLLD
jgi:hypothetical protein